jgi:hypothetical protein
VVIWWRLRSSSVVTNVDLPLDRRADEGNKAKSRRSDDEESACLILTLVLVTVLALVVAACGADTAATTTVSATETTESTTTAAEETTDTTEATESTEAEPSGDVGTMDNPVPAGTEAQVGDWLIKVVGFTPDATAAVLEANQFNDEPGTGQQYVLVELAATYTGAESGTFWMDISDKLLGVGGNTFDSGMAVAPSPISDTGETFSGASVSGQLLFLADSDQVSGSLLILEESFSLDSTRVFMALE